MTLTSPWWVCELSSRNVLEILRDEAVFQKPNGFRCAGCWTSFETKAYSDRKKQPHWQISLRQETMQPMVPTSNRLCRRGHLRSGPASSAI